MERSAYSEAGKRPLRRDARENRDRILLAARDAFARQGIDVSVEEIAARAGVGVGTLYRRFPTKDALVEAVFEAHLDQIAEAAERALADPTPGRGCSATSSTSSACRRPTAGSRRSSAPSCPPSNSSDGRGPGCARSWRRWSRGPRRPAACGDVAYEDISVLLWTTGRVVDATRDIAPEFWRRYLALTVDGLRAGAASPLPRPPLTREEHNAAMVAFTAQRRRAPG